MAESAAGPIYVRPDPTVLRATELRLTGRPARRPAGATARSNRVARERRTVQATHDQVNLGSGVRPTHTSSRRADLRLYGSLCGAVEAERAERTAGQANGRCGALTDNRAIHRATGGRMAHTVADQPYEHAHHRAGGRTPGSPRRPPGERTDRRMPGQANTRPADRVGGQTNVRTAKPTADPSQRAASPDRRSPRADHVPIACPSCVDRGVAGSWRWCGGVMLPAHPGCPRMLVPGRPLGPCLDMSNRCPINREFHPQFVRQKSLLGALIRPTKRVNQDIRVGFPSVTVNFENPLLT